MAPTAANKPSRLFIPPADASYPSKPTHSPTKGPYLHSGPAASVCSSDSDSDMHSLASAPTHSSWGPDASSDSVFLQQHHFIRDVNASTRSSVPLANTWDQDPLPNPYPQPSGSTSHSLTSHSEVSAGPNSFLMPPPSPVSPSPLGRSRSPMRSPSPLRSSSPHGHQRSLSPRSSAYFAQTRNKREEKPFSPVSLLSSPTLSSFPSQDPNEFNPYQDYVESPISEHPHSLLTHEADGDTPKAKAKGQITARLITQQPIARRAETSPFPRSPPPFSSNASIASSSNIFPHPPRPRSPLPNPPRDLDVPAALQPARELYKPGHGFSASSTSLVSGGAPRPLSLSITDLTFGHESGNELNTGGSPNRPFGHLKSQSYDAGMVMDIGTDGDHTLHSQPSSDFGHAPPSRRFGHARSHSYDPGALPIPLPSNSRETQRWPKETQENESNAEDDTIFTGFGGVGRPTPSPSPSPSPSTPARRPLPIPKPSWSTTDIPARPASAMAMGYTSPFMGSDSHLRSQSTGGTGNGFGLDDPTNFGSTPNLFGADTSTPKRPSSTSPRTKRKLVKSPSSPLASPGREGGLTHELRAQAVNYVRVYRKASDPLSTEPPASPSKKPGRKGFVFPSPKKKKGIVNGDGVFVASVQNKSAALTSEPERPRSPLKSLAGIFRSSSPDKGHTSKGSIGESPTKLRSALPWVVKDSPSSPSSLKLSLPGSPTRQHMHRGFTAKETFVIDPALPSAGLRERQRDNLRFEVEDGDMDVDVWLLGTGVLEERLVLDRTRVHMGLVSVYGGDGEKKLVVRLHAPGKHRPPFLLTLDAISSHLSSNDAGSRSVLSPLHTGSSLASSSAASSSSYSKSASSVISPLPSNAPSFIHLSLPRSFHGRIVVRSLTVNVTMAKDLRAQEITSDDSGERTFLLGEGDSLRETDEVCIVAEEGTIWVQYVDESEGDSEEARKKKAWWKH